MDEDSSKIEEDLYKIEDFSEPIKDVSGAKAGVFWDVEDYPFPNSDPDSIYEKITKAVLEKDKDDKDLEGENKISIWAYVDEKKEPWNKFLSKKTWKANLYLLPGGSKTARRKRMLHDIVLWSMDTKLNHPDPAYLIVISDQAKDDKDFLYKLLFLRDKRYSSYLVDPPPGYIGNRILISCGK